MQTRRWKRAEKRKRNCRSGFIGAAILLLGIMAEVMLPARAQANGNRFCFPLAAAQWRVSDSYGWRNDPFTGERAFHKGIDLACAEGTLVLAAKEGAVVQADYSAGYGNFLRVLHPDGAETLYAHLQYLYVRTGEVVSAGETLGTAGKSGRTTGAHLHFELKRQGKSYDPADELRLRDVFP